MNPHLAPILRRALARGRFADESPAAWETRRAALLDALASLAPQPLAQR